MKHLSCLLIALALLAFGHTAKADAIYSLNYDSCTGGCGNNGQNSSNNAFGYVTLHQVNATQVTVTLQLIDPNYFVNTGSGSNHAPFSFNTNTAVTISNIGDASGTPSTFFTVGATNASISGLGSFGYSIACTANCPNGASNGGAGNFLTFTATSSTALNLNNFIANGGGYYFAADIIGPAGRTGEVASNKAPTITGGGGSSVPEPESLALLGANLMALGAARFLRRPFRLFRP
jgi:hypothetical protein